MREVKSEIPPCSDVARMASWVDGGPCANPACNARRAAVWYPTRPAEGSPQYCHLRPCRRMGGYLPPKARGGKRAVTEDEDAEERIVEKCYEITKIVGQSFGNPHKKLCKKDRRKEPSINDVWFDVLGTFADTDDDDDPGGPDRRWLQMQDLGYVSKQAVKDAIAAYEQTAKQASKDALRGHVSAE